MFCPECKAEYIEGISQCADCKVPLVDRLEGEEKADAESVPADKNLFPIMTFLDREEAVIAKGFLESNGVNAVLSSDESIRARRGVSSPTGIQLLIREEDKQDAEKIFKLAGIYPEERPYLYEKELPEVRLESNWQKIAVRIILTVSLLTFIILVLKYFLEMDS